MMQLIGRDVVLEEVLRLAADHRLVTLTGVGGIGKTRLGLEAAQRLRVLFSDDVGFVELSSLANPDLVPITVAIALGLTFSDASMAPERVATALGSKHVLLMLDDCEHSIEAAVRMVEALLRSAPFVCVLAISQEPLRVEGEWVYQVPPLEVPPEDVTTREGLLKAGAVQLFMARARDAEPQFSPDKRIAAIAAICRRLDGIPLAIELAAARTAALGVEDLATRLDGATRETMPFLHRFLGTPVITFLTARAGGRNLTKDSQTGYRAFRRDRMEELALVCEVQRREHLPFLAYGLRRLLDVAALRPGEPAARQEALAERAWSRRGHHLCRTNWRVDLARLPQKRALVDALARLPELPMRPAHRDRRATAELA